MKKKISLGDIFALNIEDTDYYIFGKVLFDTKEQYDGNGQYANYLDWHGKSILVEMYKGVSMEKSLEVKEKINFTKFLPKSYLLDEDVTIIDNDKVDPKTVSFPEAFSNQQRSTYFVLGELAIKVPFDSDAVDNRFNKIHPTLGGVYDLIFPTLDISNRRDLMEEDDIIENYFWLSDLRSLPEKRKEVYAAIGEDPNMSYYDLALNYGFDLARLY